MFATTLPLAASKTDWSEFLPEKLVPAIGDTFYMVSITMLCAGLVGLVVGALLYTTRAGNIFQNRFVYTILNILVNVIRPIPFIILIAALGPLTSAVVGTRLGVNAAVFAMSFGAAFAIARIVEQNMVSIDPGVIEAARGNVLAADPSTHQRSVAVIFHLDGEDTRGGIGGYGHGHVLAQKAQELLRPVDEFHACGDNLALGGQ